MSLAGRNQAKCNTRIRNLTPSRQHLRKGLFGVGLNAFPKKYYLCKLILYVHESNPRMKYLRLLLLLVALAGLCSELHTAAAKGINKLLKSKDTEKIYQAAIDAYRNKKYRRATDLFDAVYNDLYSSDRVDTILFYASKAYYYQGLYSVAAEGFDQYRKNFSRRPFAEEAEFLLPMCWYNLSRPAERDQTETHKAITTFNEYLNRHPNSIKAEDIKMMLEELQQKLYEKEFINASLYFKIGQYPASVAALRYSLKDTPENPYRETMMFLICKSWYNYAKNSVPARKLDRYMKMVDSYYNFKSEFPESQDYLKELEKMFLDAQAYVEQNKQAAVDIEKDRIGAESLKESIKQQKEKLRTIRDQVERSQAQLKLKQDEATLKAQQKRIKAEAKKLKKNDAKMRRSDERLDSETKEQIAEIK